MTATKQTKTVDGGERRRDNGGCLERAHQWRSEDRIRRTRHAKIMFYRQRKEQESPHFPRPKAYLEIRTAFCSMDIPPPYTSSTRPQRPAPPHTRLVIGYGIAHFRHCLNALPVLKLFKKKLGKPVFTLEHPLSLWRQPPPEPSFHQTNVPGDHSAPADYLEPYLQGSWLRWNARRLRISMSA